MRVGRRGQIAMEYLLVSGFAFLMLVPIIAVAYLQSETFTQDVTSAQLQKIANEIVDAANAVYYEGPPAKKTFRVYFPQRITDVQINENDIEFTATGAGGSYTYILSAETNLTGSLRPFAGIHTIIVTAGTNDVSISD